MSGAVAYAVMIGMRVPGLRVEDSIQSLSQNSSIKTGGSFLISLLKKKSALAVKFGDKRINDCVLYCTSETGPHKPFVWGGGSHDPKSSTNMLT